MASGSTTNYSLSYPLSTDPVNVASDIQDLATDLDLFLTTPIFINDVRVDGGDVTTTALTATVFNTTATTLNIGQAATTVSIGATTGTTTIRNANTVVTGDFAVNGGDITTSQTTFNLINGTTTTLNIGQAATAISIGATTGTATIRNANTVVTGDLAVNGGDITTSATTFNLLNATATTLNIGAAATTTNIGNSAGQTNFAGDINIATGKIYEINNVSVLSSTTLGSSVVSSSLTSVGTIATGTWSATTIAVDKGGTGLTSYTIGDIVFASGATTLAKLAGVATGNALISGGIGAAPSYGKIGLTTHVSGTLPVANGGTGITSLGTGVATWLGTPSSANLAAAVTDETGSGSLVFSTSPSLTTPNLGSATAAYLTISAQDGVNEGGELKLNGAASFGLAIIDNYQGRLRFHNGTITRFDITDTAALFSANSLTLSMETSGAPTNNVSLKVERGTSADVDIRWNEAGDTWQFTNDGTTYFDIPTAAGGGGAGLEAVLMFAGM